MNCRLKYSNDIVNKIKDFAGIDRTSAIKLKENEYLLPVGGFNGSNEKLQTIKNTYKWAQDIQSWANDRYNSKSYGNTVVIKDHHKGTIISITIPKLLIDAYENKFGQMSDEDFQASKDADDYYNGEYYQTTNTVSKKNKELETKLKEFAQINGIQIRFIDSLVEQFGGDYTAAYDAVNKVVYVNENKAGIDTLGEEIAHSLTLALGDDHVLIKKAFNLLSKTDYKSTLDHEYVKLYKNNENALKHEVIGKMMAQVLVKQFEPKNEAEFKLFTSLLQLLDKFISLFKRNDRLEDVVLSLANKISNKETIAFSEVKGDNVHYFQVVPSDYKMPEELKKQYVFLKQQLTKDLKKLDKLDPEDGDFIELSNKIIIDSKNLEELKATGNKQIIINMGNELMDSLEIMLNNVEDDNIKLKLSFSEIAAAEKIFSTFSLFPQLAQRAQILEQRLQPISQAKALEEIKNRSNEDFEITHEDVYKQGQDISKLTGWFGKLSNSSNYLARTVHAMIKEAQVRISSLNKKVVEDIKTEVELLREYSNKNGISEKDMYNVFQQEHNGTLVLTKKYTKEFYDKLYALKDLDKKEKRDIRSTFAVYDASLQIWKPKSTKYLNPNYTKIQNTPELKKFYNYFKKEVRLALEKLPVSMDGEFIPNIASNTLSDAFKTAELDKSSQMMQIASNLTGINIKQFKDGTYIADEGLYQDLIPLKFIASIGSESKSKNLGDNLAAFVKFANSYEEMSDILPTVRSMQNLVGKQSFVNSSDPGSAIAGTETKLYEFIKTVIDMQVKGENKKDEGKIKLGDLKDAEGNIIGEKYIHAYKVADFGMKYNSLLRIGLNPINAVTNVLVGEVGNIIEAFGSKFYTIGNLASATNIFFKNALDKESDLQKWRDKIGPLQDLDDYERIEQETTGKGITKEKIEEGMYLPQKMGEVFLQNRTMIAMLIKDGYMDSSGNTTDKGNKITEKELSKLTAKVYEINNRIHGRYSSRDAAAISQYVLPRMLLQFKKWIPAAIESRFEDKHFNNDLGMEVEGRYKTGWRLLRKGLQGDLKALQAGNMSEMELYNMKKNLTEITLALGATLMLITLGAFGDDDEKLKKSPYYKLVMDQLDRTSGDLLYFYNPGSYTETVLKPMALAKTTYDLIHVVGAFPYIFGGKDSRYKAGDRKDENKFVAKVIDMTPIVAPIAKVARKFKKDVKYQSFK